MKHIERIIITDYDDENNIIFDSGTVEYNPDKPHKVRSPDKSPRATRETFLSGAAIPFKYVTKFADFSKLKYKVFQYDDEGNKEPCYLLPFPTQVFWRPLEAIVKESGSDIVNDTDANKGSFSCSMATDSDGKAIVGEMVIGSLGKWGDNFDVWFIPLIPADDSTFQCYMAACVKGEYIE